MRVCGAITATSAAMVMNTPALPARAGAGVVVEFIVFALLFALMS